MQRLPVALGYGDTLRVQGFDKALAAQALESSGVIAEDIHVMRRLGGERVNAPHGDAFEIFQQAIEVASIGRAPLRLFFQPAKLHLEQGGLNRRDAPVAGRHGEVPAFPGTQAAASELSATLEHTATPQVVLRDRSREDIDVIGEHRAALTRVEVLAGLEAEAANVADGPQTAVAPGAGVGMRRILDDAQSMGGRDVENRLHVASQPAEMHGHDRRGARGDRGRNARRVQVVGRGVDIGKDRHQARVEDRRGAGHERERRQDDFRAPREPQRFEPHLQGAGAAVDRQAVGRALGGGKSALEGDDAVAAEPPPLPSSHDVSDGVDLGVVEDRPCRIGVGADRVPA